MSIHQLTTLAGTASKPYLLRGNQQVTDQIHYGAAPAAGGSRAGAAPGPGGCPRTFWGEMSPAGCSGWDEHPQALRKCLCVIKLFPVARKRSWGCRGGSGQVPKAAGSPPAPCPSWGLGGGRLRPSLQGKGLFMHPKMSELERGAGVPKPCLHLSPRIWTKSWPRIRRPRYFF